MRKRERQSEKFEQQREESSLSGCCWLCLSVLGSCDYFHGSFSLSSRLIILMLMLLYYVELAKRILNTFKFTFDFHFADIQ